MLLNPLERFWIGEQSTKPNGTCVGSGTNRTSTGGLSDGTP
jgi:hypothetical protein